MGTKTIFRCLFALVLFLGCEDKDMLAKDYADKLYETAYVEKSLNFEKAKALILEYENSGIMITIKEGRYESSVSSYLVTLILSDQSLSASSKAEFQNWADSHIKKNRKEIK